MHAVQTESSRHDNAIKDNNKSTLVKRGNIIMRQAP